MTWGIYSLVFLVVVVASTVQSSVGMGQGLVAAPLLRLLEPDLLPGPIVLAGLLTSTVLALRNSRPGDLAQVAPAVGGRFVGSGIAIGLLAILSERGLTIVIGSVVLAFVALRLLGLRIARTLASLSGAGLVSGISGTIAALGGAPMGLLYEQHSSARDFRGPMGMYMTVGGAVSVGLLSIAGQMDGQAWLNGLALLPPLALGWLFARWVTPIVDKGFLSPIVLALSSGSALVLILSELL